MRHFNSIGKGLALCLLLAAAVGLPQSAWAETAVWDGSMVRPSQGNGTPENPFLINTAEEMAYLIQNYDHNSGIFHRKFYKLTRDLDMKSTQWTFGSATSDHKTFQAHFDGGGHKISNIEITIQDSPKEAHYGLFPQLGGDPEFESVIENLEVENIHFVRSSGDANGTYNLRIGGLIGQQYAHSRISNCIVHGFAVTDYGSDVILRSTSRISACPLVGEIQHKFGDTGTFHKERGIMIESCYGHGTADLSHFHGREDQLFKTDVQGRKMNEGYSYNGYEWHEIGNDDNSFSMFTVEVTPAMSGQKFTYEGYFPREKGHTYTYRWFLDGKRIGNNTSATIKVEPKPYMQRLGLTLFDNGHEAGSGAILIEPDMYNLSIDSVGPGAKKNTYLVSGKIATESGIAISEEEFDFSWQDMTDGFKEVCDLPDFKDAKDGHSYMLLASHRKHKSAKFSIIKSFTKPIYVCNRGISEFEASIYTNDGKTYEAGNDANDGSTPEASVRTLKRAYQLLKKEEDGGNIGNNVIIIMGDYSEYDFTEYLDNRCTRLNPKYFPKDRPATITGRSENFKNGRILLAGLSIKLGADTRFEQINIHGSSFEITEPTDQSKVFACGHNLTMGYGIIVNGFKTMDWTLGMTEGIFVPTITLYGGLLNNNDPDYVPADNTIKILSGIYGRIIAGDGFTLQMEKTGNVSGSPQRPVRTKIECDIANYFDPYHSQYDVALIIGGQADGTVFADTRIEVKGTSRIGRIVGGNVAFGRAMPGKPADSFFGQSEITVSGGEVTDVIGTNLGRYGHILYPDELDHDSCVTYFYGRSNLNLIGGTIHNTVYGGGHADVIGFDYDGVNHTLDPHIPYIKNGQIVYGTYAEAKGNIPTIVTRNGVLDLTKTELHINIGGDAYLRGSVYGGSETASQLLPTRQAGSQSGCIFGDTYINVSGGVVDGFIFGGCHSNLTYFEKGDNSNYPIVQGRQTDKMFFTRIGQLFGNTHITISSGEVKGMIFGGGEGAWYRPVSDTDPTNAVDKISAVYGTTNIVINGDAILHEYVFGSGSYAHVLRTGKEADVKKAGSTDVKILGGKLYGAVFGAGHGYTVDNMLMYSRVQGDSHVKLSGGLFYFNDNLPRYVDRRLYGVLGGGISTSSIEGDSHVTIESNPFTADLMQATGVNVSDDIFLCGGGYEKDCPIVGCSNVIINAPQAPIFNKIYGGGVFGNVGATNVQVWGGKVGSIFGGCRNGRLEKRADIFIGTKNNALKNNDAIAIENIYGGDETQHKEEKPDAEPVVANMKVYGGSVTNVFGVTEVTE